MATQATLPTSSDSLGQRMRRGVAEFVSQPLNVVIVVFFLLIVCSGAALFMLLVGWIKYASADDLDAAVEINSQILNACFTASALVVAPSRILNLYRVAMLWGSTQDSDQSQKVLALSVAMEAAYKPMRWRTTEYPAGTNVEGDVGLHQVAIVKRWKWLTLILLLNGQHLFQWPITVAMWGWAGNHRSRPSYLVYGFLPLSFLCGTVGGIWFALIGSRINKAIKKRIAEDADEEGHSESHALNTVSAAKAVVQDGHTTAVNSGFDMQSSKGPMDEADVSEHAIVIRSDDNNGYSHLEYDEDVGTPPSNAVPPIGTDALLDAIAVELAGPPAVSGPPPLESQTSRSTLLNGSS